MDKNIKISVVTVVYNGEKTLENTILSVIKQSYKNIEYIIIDGNSTDSTLDIIRKYDTDISICISEPDKGIYDAMNKALKIASGDFLIFMGADDVFINVDTISTFVSLLQRTNESFEKVYYGNVIKVSNNEKYDGIFSKEKIAVKNICHQSIFYPKKIYKTYTYNLRYKLWADYAYNLKIFPYMQYIDLDISFFNDTGISSKKSDNEFRKDVYGLVIRNLGIKCLFILLIEKIKRRLFRRKIEG